jgi:outer membrane protein TolC
MCTKTVRVFLLLGLASLEARAQGPYPPQTSPPAPVGASQSGTLTPPVFSGSVPSGPATAETISLSLREAIARGLKQNLGALLSGYSVGGARGEKWRQLSALLPNSNLQLAETASQIDLAALGFTHFPGIPKVIGPFGYTSLRASLDQTFFDWSQINRVRSSNANLEAAKFSYLDARDLVVLAVGNAYLQAVAGDARVEAAEAQQATAQALYDLARDQLKAGLAPSIDALRAQVELEARRQQSITARNDFAKEKLQLGRVIGLPLGQAFTLADKALYEPMVQWTVEQALDRAYATRPDYQSVRASLRAAQRARDAAGAEYLPTLGFAGDYGVVGVNPAQSHGVFDASIALNVPVFQGNRVHGEILVAQAALDQARAQVENLRGQIDYDVRAAFLDLHSAAERVDVARSNLQLANETLAQSQDRFRAGVTNNVEVVQAQEAVASANESYISSLYTYDLAKISLARAGGNAEVGIEEYLKGK